MQKKLLVETELEDMVVLERESNFFQSFSRLKSLVTMTTPL